MVHDFTVWYVSTSLAVSFRTLSVYNYIVVVVSNIYLLSGEFEIKQMDQLLEELCSDRWYVINFFKILVNLQFCADADRKDLLSHYAIIPSINILILQLIGGVH